MLPSPVKVDIGPSVHNPYAIETMLVCHQLIGKSCVVENEVTYCFSQWLSQAITVSCQRMELPGFRTQWLSSGK